VPRERAEGHSHGAQHQHGRDGGRAALLDEHQNRRVICSVDRGVEGLPRSRSSRAASWLRPPSRI
jgi:hypothetical protein